MFTIWTGALIFFSNFSLLLITIPNCLFLLTMLIRADTFERKDHIQRKKIFNLAIFKSLVEIFVLSFMIYNYWKNTLAWNSQGILLCVTGILDLVYFALGIFILHKTKEVIQILDLDIYSREMSSYFQISNL